MSTMASVHDVAAFILAELGQSEPVGAMKLQKLVYYAQAWSLVWDEQPLFSEKIEAWDRGPVVRALYHQHSGAPFVARVDRGDPANLSVDQRATIAAVLQFYGKRSAAWLSELTHREPPWLDARGASGGAPNPVIATTAMHAFFSTYPASKRHIPESIARGLEVIVGLPRDVVQDVLQGAVSDALGIEEWLAKGEGDPWQTSAG